MNQHAVTYNQDDDEIAYLTAKGELSKAQEEALPMSEGAANFVTFWRNKDSQDKGQWKTEKNNGK